MLPNNGNDTCEILSCMSLCLFDWNTEREGVSAYQKALTENRVLIDHYNLSWTFMQQEYDWTLIGMRE